MVVEFSILGLDPILEKMRSIPVELRKKPGRSALGSAARVVANAAKQNALSIDDAETGRRIADNVTQRFRSRYFKQTGDLKISVGVGTEKGRIPKGNPDTGAKGNTPHWHLVELGTEKMRAEPFLQPGLEQNISKATDTFVTQLDLQLDKIIKKQGGAT
ncbi:HK97-gp10 family putative phage morphogenesis protein [Delftia acidovorans]|uniref:HK97 gp10 family phage protein n=1 Tax=Delftia acidovorans TaxID=80866 RepID=A0AAJ2VAC2_DELAC|nr:HK97-gp10 family putative phage morphogenesis protein [Delftia acidovorans]MDX4957929.1 HK97 gp10 family phage protein [Delftia acidovorans]